MAYQSAFYDRESNHVHIWDDIKGYFSIPYKRYGYLLDSKGKYNTIDDKKAKKVTSWSKDDEKAGMIYESDVSPVTRTLIDMYYDTDEISTNHNIIFLDIEVESKNGFPHSDVAENTITAISMWSSNTKKYYVFILDFDNKIKTLHSTKEKEFYISKTEKELLNDFFSIYSKLNATIIVGWNSYDFDIPYLYNRSVKVLGRDGYGELYADKLSPISIVDYNGNRINSFVIAGVNHLDLMELYKYFTYNVEPAYTLDFICKKELGYGKIEYDGSLDDLYTNDINKFIEYNINDVQLLVELDKKLDFINLAMNICHTGHVVYEDILYTSRYLDGAALTFCKNNNLVAPNSKDEQHLVLLKNHYAGEDKLYVTEPIIKSTPRRGLLKIKKTKTTHVEVNYSKYIDNYFVLELPLQTDLKSDSKLEIGLPGAHVKIPTPGLYGWGFDLDLESLYPTTMMTLNVSLETKYGRILNWDATEFNKQTVKEYKLEAKHKKSTLSKDELLEYLTVNKLVISANGILYVTDKKGILPAILEMWFDKRREYKSLASKYYNNNDMERFRYFDKRQLVQKIMLNSFYGVLGLPSFRFYDIDNAEAVTSSGVQTIKFTEKMINIHYNKLMETKDIDYVIYLDTDSCFISALPLINHRGATDINDVDSTIKAVESIAIEFEEFINSSYNLYTKKFFNADEHKLRIKQENIFRSGLWLAKKRYALWIIYEKGLKINKIDYKGIDVVRSDFPPSFRGFFAEIIEEILMGETNNKIMDEIFTFKNSLSSLNILEVMYPKGIKNIVEYDKHRSKFSFNKGTPAHVKASLSYNDLIDYYGLTNYDKIHNGNKIRWAYLKDNPFYLDSLAVRGYNDPPQIIDYITKYINYDMMFDNIFKNKIMNIFDALGWSYIKHESVNEFFEF
jgi:DNA polymerase elongation subunit (family B)